jgi:hypothetical protein
MKNNRIGVILFALLLTAGVMIPFVTAENVANSSGTVPVVSENGTVTIDGITLPVVEVKVYPFNASEFSTPLTKEQFITVNRHYIEYLTEHFGKERAEQMMNAEYDRHTNSSARAGSTPDGEGILSIDPVGDHAVGENFFINGTAILPAGIDITIRIYRGSFNPGIPPQADPWYDHIPKTVRVKYNNKTGNIWSYAVNTTGSYPDEYLVFVEYPRDSTINATAIFNLVPRADKATTGAGQKDEYVIMIDPVGNHTAGDIITITGTTNLPTGEKLLIEVISSNNAFGSKVKDNSGAVGVVDVREGVQGKNTWSFMINSSDLKPDNYTVIVQSYRDMPVNDSLSSVILEENNPRSSSFFTLDANPVNSPAWASPPSAGIIFGSLIIVTFLTMRRMS